MFSLVGRHPPAAGVAAVQHADPAQPLRSRTLRTIHEHRPDVLAVVPVMISGSSRIDPPRSAALRRAACAWCRQRLGVAGELALRWMDLFGDNVCFTARPRSRQASIAMPDRLRAVPGTAGVAARHHRQDHRRSGPRGADQDHRPHLRHQRNQFEGYTGGATGGRRRHDVERRRRALRRQRLLFVDGATTTRSLRGETSSARDQDLLADHRHAEAAVIGVADSESSASA
jgi:hypothetical protein